MYPVFEIDNSNLIRDETLGTKDKYWVKFDNKIWLFKAARDHTGEDWSEKVSYEVAKVLRINAAEIELATYQGNRGTLSLSFLDTNEGDVLIHGNEILAGQVLGYDPSKHFHQSDHTVNNIQIAISELFNGSKAHKPILKNLASYMVLDALIGNTDRHHENWGLLMRRNQTALYKLNVAPTYDHASSLGRELSDVRRQEYLDNNFLERYIRRGKGAIFHSNTDARGANPLELVEIASKRYPEYFMPSLERLNSVTIATITAVVDDVPEHIMSPISKEFTKQFMSTTYTTLCNLTN